MPDLHETFDRVVVVNLARRPERMASFLRTLGSDWPFHAPSRFEAIDGSVVRLPDEWKQGRGAWGCMLSHREVMRSAIADDLNSILILEDDALPVPDFASGVANFLKSVPPDWDGLMLGGQHLVGPSQVTTGVVRCASTQRTHAFAVHRRMMPGLLKFWETVTNDHCDIVLAACMSYFKVYAPDPFLIGQAAGLSDITMQATQMRFLSEADQLAIAAQAVAQGRGLIEQSVSVGPVEVQTLVNSPRPPQKIALPQS